MHVQIAGDDQDMWPDVSKRALELVSRSPHMFSCSIEGVLETVVKRTNQLDGRLGSGRVYNGESLSFSAGV